MGLAAQVGSFGGFDSALHSFDVSEFRAFLHYRLVDFFNYRREIVFF